MTPLEVLDRARRHTFMGLWDAGVAMRGLFAIAPLPEDHGFPEDVLAPFRAGPPLGGLVPLDFAPSWPMGLAGDEQDLVADFIFGTRRCRCRLPWRSLLRLEVAGVGGVQFETVGMDAPPVPAPAPSATERPVVEHDGNVARVQFGRPRPRPVEDR